MKRDIENIIVIGGGDGICESEGNLYVKKTAVGTYLEDLHKNANDFQLITSEFRYDDFDNLDKLNIPSGNVLTHPSISNPLLLFMYIYTLLGISYEFLKKENVTLLVFLPGFVGYVHIIIFTIISDNIVLYYGADPYRTIWTQRTVTTPIRLISYPVLDFFAIYKANLILYRDVGIEKRYKKIKKNNIFHRSKPLIDLNDDDIFERQDTCQDKPITVLYVGTLSDRKGVTYLLDSIKQLRLDGYEVELTIVGNGDQFENLKDKSKKLGIEGIVKFHGHISNKNKLVHIYRKSDIFALPTLGEGFPRVLTEAMTQSLPIITTDVGEIGTRLSQDEAVIVDPGKPKQLKQGIENLIQNQDRRQNQIKNGRDWVKEFVDETAFEQHTRLIRTYVYD